MNTDVLRKALALCRNGLASYIVQALQRQYLKDYNDESVWWQRCVLAMLPHAQNKPRQGSLENLVRSLDLSDCFSLMLNTYWDKVFLSSLPQRHTADVFKNQCYVIRSLRNLISHPTGDAPEDISKVDLNTALTAIEYVLAGIGSPLSNEIATIKSVPTPALRNPVVQFQTLGRPTDQHRLTNICTESVYQAVASIPVGSVMTYADLAEYISSSRNGAQAVATILLHNSHNSNWKNCHRVVLAEGRLSPGYKDGLGVAAQRKELEAENIGFDFTGKVEMDKYKWKWREAGQ